MNDFPNRVRYKIMLGKFQVKKVVEHGPSTEWFLEFPGLGVLGFIGPKADIKEGDLLTIYTEILAPERSS